MQKGSDDGRSVSVTFNMTEHDYMAACRVLWAWQGLGSMGQIAASAIVAACGLIVMFLGGSGWFVAILLLGAVGLVGMFRLRDWMWRRYFRRYFAGNGPFTVRFGPDGIQTASAQITQTVDSSFYRQHLVSDTALFLIRDQRLFSILPRAAFQDPSDWDAATALVARHLTALSRRRV